jgi:hypothetical protein
MRHWSTINADRGETAKMDILSTILSAGGGNLVRQVAGQFGTDEAQTGSALSQLVRVLGQGVAQNAATPSGLESLTRALSSGGHGRYLDSLSSLTDPAARTDGNGILGHILGSPDVSRALAGRVANQSGMSQDMIKKLLPIAAMLVMGALSKRTQGGSALGGLLGGLVGQGDSNAAPAVRPAAQASASPLGGLLGMFDRDGDGSAADDILKMAASVLMKR